MQFAAIDVETANADLSSICQVGVAIHGIGEQKAKGAQVAASL